MKKLVILGVLGVIASMGLAQAAELNPAAIKILTPDQFVWSGGSAELQASSTNLYGDREGVGYYVYINVFQPGQFSRPHFHANDRFITVLKGTWWVGTGTTYDPDSTVPVPTGAFVTHYGKEIHYDGAKDEEVWVMISGMGPSAGTPAEEPN